MRAEKKVVGHLTKCYSVAPLFYKGNEYFLTAAEKEDPCLLFDMDGNKVDTVWEGPGGTMSMVQVPDTDGQFLATQKFYSPNDSKEAKIVLVTPDEAGNWQIKTIAVLPHVHRFDLLKRGETRYLIACTIKSGHEYKEDWSSPGKVYAAVLPENLSVLCEKNPLQLEVIQEGMLKNHGYYRVEENGMDTGLISYEGGVCQFIPPARQGEPWEVNMLLDTPASDAVLVDFDQDGERELAVLSPFHGDCISIYKKYGGNYQKVYEYEKPAEFSHAIYGGSLCRQPALVVGHRQGNRNLICFTWNQDKQAYQWDILDQDCGPANVLHKRRNGEDWLISANRETDEIAMYRITQ
ncbi:hypothetical protein [Lacrimispora sp.]|jgi:hypothetical protein|uniref:hypothetical protein n=1 Tax=Lacrimispora sp. TaxID=2719234 RepID=UPI0029E0F7AD|nr:hypothetical protein [Lacrimispora sp.]